MMEHGTNGSFKCLWFTTLQCNAVGGGVFLAKVKEIKMLKEIQSENITVYLTFSPWGNHEVKGEVIEFNDSWLKLKNKKQ